MTRIYAAMEQELLVVSDRNGRWQTEAQLAGTSPQCVGVDPLSPEYVYCGTFDDGLWRSADAGNSWERVGDGIAYKTVIAVAVSSAERRGGRGVIYAGTEPSALYRSENGGKSWKELGAMRELPSRAEWSFPPRPGTSHVRWISADPHVSGRVFVAIEAGALVRTDDSGETWKDRTPDSPRDTHTLVTQDQVPGRLYSAAGDGFMRAGMGYAESYDAGETWERVGEGLNHHYLWGLAVHPSDPETVLVSAAAGPVEAHEPKRASSTIYRKEAGGPWQEVTDGLPESTGRVIAILASDKMTPGVFYALTNLGLYRSTDTGRSWNRLDIAWPERYRHQHQNALAVS